MRNHCYYPWPVSLFSAPSRSLLFNFLIKASIIKLHDRMFQSVTRAPLLFFRSNPIGILLHFQNIKTKIEYLQFINFFKCRPHFKPIFQRYWKHRRRTSCYVHGPNYSKKYVLYLVNSFVASKLLLAIINNILQLKFRWFLVHLDF